MPETANIQLSRISKWVYKLRKFGIFVDGNKIGEIANGQEEIFTLSSGEHQIYLKTSWVKSETITLTLQPGEIISFECGTPIILARWVFGGVILGVVSQILSYLKTMPASILKLALLLASLAILLFIFCYCVWLFLKPGRFIYLKYKTIRS